MLRKLQETQRTSMREGWMDNLVNAVFSVAGDALMDSIDAEGGMKVSSQYWYMWMYAGFAVIHYGGQRFASIVVKWWSEVSQWWSLLVLLKLIEMRPLLYHSVIMYYFEFT